MAGRDRRHALGRAAARWLPVVLVLAVLAGAVAAYRFDLGERWFGAAPDPATQPAEVPPPDGVTVPALAEPDPVAEPEPPGTLAPARVRRALAPGLRDRDLGRSVHATVAGLEAGSAPAFTQGPGPFIPASTTKLLTTEAALEALGPDHRFATTVRARGRRLVLVGGGDPLLAREPDPASEWPVGADLATLARETVRGLDRRQRRARLRLAYDDSMFRGPEDNPFWRPDYVPDDIVSPITALWVDEGRDPSGFGRVDDPAAAAADAFAAALRRQGLRVQGQITEAGTTHLPEVARVESAPLSQIVERTLLVSDNEAAEVLAHHVGLAVEDDASFAGGARGVRRTLSDLGVPVEGVVLRDGSGLSRHNRMPARTLVEVLRAAAAEDAPELRAVLTGLPVAAFTGSLATRFDGTPEAGVGHVRAKTGTLTGVSSLAGIATDRSGTPLVFVLAADRVRLADTLDAREALDDLAGALGACRCSR